MKTVSRWFGFALFSAVAAAQAPTGNIKGRVIDSVRAVVPAAEVRVIHLATNITTRTLSNGEGNFELRGLIPGNYRLEAGKDGFKHYLREPVEVRVADVLNLEVALELGAVTENITVRAETPLLESATASVGQVIDTRRIEGLPSPGNSVLYMLQTAPTISVTTSPTNLWPPDAVGSASGTTVAGSTGTSEFMIDGNPMMTRGGGYTFNPQPEMVQEFRVQVAAFDASIGRFTGANINMVMKSGTNSNHGSFIYSNLSRGFMAHDFFTNRFIYDTRTGPITSQKIDQSWPPQRVIRYRGNIGGPLVLPRLYNGRNRTFWIFGGDGVIRQRASRATYNVPDTQQRNGDFSALLALGAQYQIYDPATIRPAANGRFSRLPLAGNIVPVSRIDPAAKQLIAYYPSANTPGNRDGTANYTDPNLADSPYVGYMGRVDHVINDNHRLFLSLNRAYTDPISDLYFHNISTGTIRTRVQSGIALNDTWVVRRSWVLELRYGLNRFSDPTRPPSIGFDLSTLGLPASLTGRLDKSLTTIPQTAITGLTGIGGASGANPNTTYHTFGAQTSHPKGNHSLRLGAEYRLLLENVSNYGNVSPAYSFGTNWTQGPLDNSGGAPVGQGLASFLLGLPTGGSISRNASTAESSGYWSLFLQDDYKLTRKLMVNAGLRWEYETAITERYDRSSRGFDFQTANPIQSAAAANYARNPIPELSASAFRTTGGLLFAGVNGVTRRYLDPDANNFAPRIGLAWHAASRTVLRAGYAIFYEPLGSDRLDSLQQGYSRSTTMAPSLDNGQTFQATLRNPFPNGILDPIGSTAGLRTFLGQGITFLTVSRRSPYTQRWSFNIQHELPQRVLIDIGYLGNRGTRLATSRDLNAVPAQYLSRLLVRDTATINFLSQQVPNPFFGLSDFAGSGLQGQNVSRAQLLRPYPHFTSVSSVTGGGSSWYHAAILRAEKRFSKGYTMQLSYTYSKAMEAVDYLNSSDPAPTHVVSANDRTHNLSMSAVFELPLGKGRRFLSSSRWTDLAAGGWSFQSIYQYATGLPLGFGNALFYG
ncbi:MAG: carboxypeptidase regulatory-like domain-containing protein, partial [Acidobacteria bacterium]|nr:carboxypeptidase regulatory-like domain-containing protein [Acidobacteriota bacterium]